MRFIGSKRGLLDEIESFLAPRLIGDEESFLDIFAGTNVVANHFKPHYKILTNDSLYFSYVNARAIIENNGDLQFEGLRSMGIQSPIDHLQRESDIYAQGSNIQYYEENYTPTGGAMYFTVENGKRIDFIREQIETWNLEGSLTDREYYYLLSTLIEAIPFVSNTTGTYGAYLKHWDKRALNALELSPLAVINNNRSNECFNDDSNSLVSKVSGDIVYVDPPYNNRQYASNYHLLENIARHEKPELNGISRIFDWSGLKSDYSQKRTALSTMKNLITKIDCTHLILSYNNEGIIDTEDLVELIRENSCDGQVDVKKIPYKKYKSKIPSESDEVYEVLLYIRKKRKKKELSPLARTTENKILSSWSPKTSKFVKSPMNYIGGKYRLLKQIIPLFPSRIETFVDLFSGGANIGINVDANKHILNDMNYKVNEIFRMFAESDAKTIILKIHNRISEFQLSKHNEVAYLKFRKRYNKNPNPLDLYILTCFSYNYQVRFNNAMEFNNPFGRDRSCFSKNMENNLILFVNKLKTLNAIFTDEYFDVLDLSSLQQSDFVYLDPPYLITTGNYNDGNRGFRDWNEEQELKMYDLLRELSSRKIKYALSNVLEHKGNTHDLLKIFIEETGALVNILDYNYDNASHNSKKRGSIEVLVTNYDPSTDTLLA